MSYDIDKYAPVTGRTICEDGTIVNSGDLLKGISPGKTKGDATVLDLTAVTSIELAAQTTAVDITVDAAVDVYMGFALNPAAANAPYKLAAGGVYNLSVSPDDGLTLYFATAGAAFGAGDYIRIQEWED